MTQALTTIAVESQHRRISSEPPEHDSDQNRRTSGHGANKFEVSIEMKPLVESNTDDSRLMPNGLGDDVWPRPRSAAAMKEVAARATNL